MQCSFYKHIFNRILLFYKYLQALSADVVLGACINSALLSKYLQVSLSPSIIFSLASATWIIYTTDHLLDAQKLKDKTLGFRYLFHHKNKQILITLVIILLIINILNLQFLPFIILRNGILTALGVLAYFGLLRLAKGNPSFFKELTIGSLYVVALFLAPLSLYKKSWNTDVYILFAEYFLLAMMNLLAFSFFESDLDEQAKHSSVVRKLGKAKVSMLIKGIALVLLGIGVLSVALNNFNLFIINELCFYSKIQLCIGLMNLVLATLLIFPSFFQKNEQYRILGDMVFLFPVVLL